MTEPLTNVIHVYGIGLDARKEAVFRMAFRMHKNRLYHLMSPEDTSPARLVIADLDSPEGLQMATKFQNSNPQIPVLGVSTTPENFSGWQMLRKPIRMETLFPALEGLLSRTLSSVGPSTLRASDMEQNQSTVTTFSVSERMPEPKPTSENNEQKPAPPDSPRAVAPPRFAPAPLLHDTPHFDSAAGLLGILQRIRRDGLPADIYDALDGQLLWRISPAENQVTSSLTTQEQKEVAERSENHLQLRAVSATDQFPAGKGLQQCHLEELLWSVAAWTANGRLPNHLSISTPVKLRHWPNLTRLAPLPDALRLAAFLARSPASPALTAKMLQVDARHLCNFLAATDSLGLLAYHLQPIAQTTAPDAQVMSVSEADSLSTPKAVARRGFLGRLLSKIAGL